MKYIILTFTIEGVAGGATYVSTKVSWLKRNGWGVVVFDHFAGLDLRESVFLPSLQPFRSNRMLELFFPPAYYSKKQRNHILNKLCDKIGKDDDYVIESNTTRMALWGELLAQRLGAKHLFLDINENVKIKNKEEYDFSLFKLLRNELFCITPRSVILKFSDWKKISEADSENHMFDAMMDVGLEDVDVPEVKKLPNADYKILSFGRWKPYFDNMIIGVTNFASRHVDHTVALIFLGDVLLTEDERTQIIAQKNIKYYFIAPQRPIPRSVFDYSDVVIATSGCAEISCEAGYKTISMNVENNQPLGVMGYTTTRSVYEDSTPSRIVVLDKLLEEVLCENKYKEPTLKIPKPTKGLEWQLTLVNNDRVYWNKVDTIYQDCSYKKILIIILLRLGLIRFIPLLYSKLK